MTIKTPPLYKNPDPKGRNLTISVEASVPMKANYLVCLHTSIFASQASDMLALLFDELR